MVTSQPSWETEEQLVRVAWYYYVDQLTQDEIASKLSISRASTGRLLDRSRKSGIVSFTINSQAFDTFRLSRALREKFSLREVIVPPTEIPSPASAADLADVLSRGAAQYLQNSLNRGDMLGLGFGVTVNATMSRLPVELMSKVSTVTLTGGVNTYIPLMNRGSRGALQRESVIASPLIVSTADLAHQLRQENVVDRTMQLARTATHALIGIGPVAGESTLVNDGYMTPEEMNALANQGAVGDVLGIFYNAAGEQLETDLSERRIGISFTELKQIPTVVAVAGGTSKLDAIRGVLNAGVIDVFVTTEDIAAALVGEE